MRLPSKVIALLLLGMAVVGGCGSADHTATYFDARNDAAISVELRAAHPYLAEYDRMIRMVTRDGVEVTHPMKMDTGGYVAINVYVCARNVVMLDSYMESVSIDAVAGTFRPERCVGGRRYVGVFDGAGQEPFLFHPASERAEEKLEMRGS